MGVKYVDEVGVGVNRFGTSMKLTTALDFTPLPFLSTQAYSLMTTVSISRIGI